MVYARRCDSGADRLRCQSLKNHKPIRQIVINRKLRKWVAAVTTPLVEVVGYIFATPGIRRLSKWLTDSISSLINA